MSETAPVEEEARPEGEAPEEDAQFADDRTLSPEFVRSVADAIEAEDAEAFEGLTREMHPADIADLVGLLHEEDRESLIGLLDGALPSGVLAELDEDILEDVVEVMEPAKVAEAVAELETDDAAFVLEDLDEEKQAEILALAPVEDRLALRAALDFEEESAGRLMQREFFATPAFWTVGQIIDRLRGTEDLPDRFYEVFVVDPSFRPVGSVPLSTLLKSPRETVIETLMSSGDMRTVPVTMDQEEVAYLFEQYNLISTVIMPISLSASSMTGVEIR
ncbi:MAG: magnesium transporter, partial [Pseudomonadota bacterium]